MIALTMLTNIYQFIAAKTKIKHKKMYDGVCSDYCQAQLQLQLQLQLQRELRLAVLSNSPTTQPQK